MIGTLPVYAMASLEYRLAIDAASVWLARSIPVGLRCEQPALEHECRQRLPVVQIPPWQSLLWLEPQYSSWRPALDDLASHLLPGARLAVLLSLPAARHLPGFHAWGSDPLGVRFGGWKHLQQELAAQSFILDTARAFHGGQSVFWSTSSRVARLLHRCALADRLEFNSRLHYLQPLAASWLSTCALLLAHRP
jgi:hypothetical protein